MTFRDWVEIAAIGEFVFGLVAGAILGVIQYKILQAIVKLKKEIDGDMKALDGRFEDKIQLVQQRMDLQIEKDRREYSTQLLELQKKAHETEVKTYDTFARRSSLGDATARIERGIDELGKSISRDVDGLSGRLDVAVAGLNKRIDDAVISVAAKSH